MGACAGGLTRLRGQQATGSADALGEARGLSLGRVGAEGHGQEVVEVEGMGLALGQAGQAAAGGLQRFLFQDLTDAVVHA